MNTRVPASFVILLSSVLLCVSASAQHGDAPRVTVDPSGSVHVPAMVVPVSEFLSPEGKAYLAEHLLALQHPERLTEVDGIPSLIAPYLDRQRVLFPVDRDDTEVGGVHAYV
jgi:epsilon-lactone hydrolase